MAAQSFDKLLTALDVSDIFDRALALDLPRDLAATDERLRVCR